jgi:hypothetical protein
VAPEVEYLLWKHKTLSSNSSLTKKKKRFKVKEVLLKIEKKASLMVFDQSFLKTSKEKDQ